MKYIQAFKMLKVSSVMPELIYKYRNWDKEFHKGSLLESYIYFANPNSFPDKDDSYFMNYKKKSLLKKITKKSWLNELYWTSLLRNPSLTKDNFDLIIECQKKLPIDLVEKNHNDVHREKFGIFSATFSENSEQHWNEYSEFSIESAFCIVYNGVFLRDVLSRLGMPYSRVIYPLSPKKFYLDDETTEEMRLVFTFFQKRPKYKWEDEFRMVYLLARGEIFNRKFYHEPQAVMAIYIHRAARKSLEIEIYDALPDQLKHIQIVRAT